MLTTTEELCYDGPMTAFYQTANSATSYLTKSCFVLLCSLLLVDEVIKQFVLGHMMQCISTKSGCVVRITCNAFSIWWERVLAYNPRCFGSRQIQACVATCLRADGRLTWSTCTISSRVCRWHNWSWLRQVEYSRATEQLLTSYINQWTSLRCLIILQHSSTSSTKNNNLNSVSVAYSTEFLVN